MNNTTPTQEITKKVNDSRLAFEIWQNSSMLQRIEALTDLFNLFEDTKEEISKLITQEIGKPISQAKSEIKFFQSFNKWTLENAQEILADKVLFEDNNSIHKLTYEPIGVTAAIIAWNSPFGLLSWKLFSNLIVGNTLVIKHSEYCPILSKYLDDLIKKSSLPENIVTFVYGDSETGKALLDQNIDMVSFTGSTKTGREIYKKAGEKFIKSTMELGGSNPAIVFEDTDINLAVESIINSRFANCGQNCDATKRLIIHSNILKEFTEKLSAKLQTLTIGVPMNETTYFGPLVSSKQLHTAKEQLKDAIDRGASIQSELRLPENLSGYYFSPTIISDISKDMKVWQEEVFTPILPIIAFNTKDEAIELANDTIYGLGATIFTQDKELFNDVASKINAGNIMMNNISQWLSCNPFGGYKMSGIGRENGEEGLKKLAQVKVLSIEK